MKTPPKNNPWLRFLRNKYVWVLLFFFVWMIFLDNYSWLDHRTLDKEIEELEDNKAYYKNEIRSDSTKIRKLHNPDEIERYARENYYMKKDSEDIYIIEFEEDDLKDQ